MDFESVHILYQSRKTLLKILAMRGYNTTPFETFGPGEISAMFQGGSDAFRMDLEKEAAAAAAAAATGPAKCRVIYRVGPKDRVKGRLEGFIKSLVDEDNEDAVDTSTTEVVVIVMEPVVELFHQSAVNALVNPNNKKLRIAFFQAHTLVNNPLDHVLVPKHEILPAAEHPQFMAQNKIRSKTALPIIKFHEDMIARILGAQPGDIIKITRPSPSAGEYIMYRLCSP